MQTLSQKNHHQTPMIEHMGTVISYTSKLFATEVEIQFLSTLISLLPPFGSAFFLFQRRECPSTFAHFMNVQVIDVW